MKPSRLVNVIQEIQQNTGLCNLNSQEERFLVGICERTTEFLNAESLTNEDWRRLEEIAARKPAKSSLSREERLEELRKLTKIFREEIGLENVSNLDRRFLFRVIDRSDKLEDVAVDHLHILRDIKDKCLEKGKHRSKIR